MCAPIVDCMLTLSCRREQVFKSVMNPSHLRSQQYFTVLCSRVTFSHLFCFTTRMSQMQCIRRGRVLMRLNEAHGSDGGSKACLIPSLTTSYIWLVTRFFLVVNPSLST